MPDKIDQLFDDLQSRGYAKDKTRKQFRDYMLAPGKQGYENRKTFFDDFKSNGETNLGSYEDFKGLLGLHAVKKPAGQTPSVYQKAKQQTQKAAPAVQQQSTQQGGVSPYLARQDNYTRPGSLVEQLNQRDAEAEQAITQPLRETGKKVRNNKFTPQRMGTQYVDDKGNVVKDETFDVYPLMPEETREDIENRKAYERMTSTYDAEKDLENDLRDIRSEEEKLTARRKSAEGVKNPEDKTWWDFFREGFGASAVNAVAPMGTNIDRSMVENEMARKGAYGKERQDIMKEQDVLIARKRLAEEAQQVISDAKKDKNGYGVFGGLARAGEKVLETALNPRTWDFGEADLSSQMAVADAVVKMDSGLGVSDNERKLLDTWAKNAAINSQFGDQLSGWTKAGMVTGESLPFMLEMAMNPASGLGEAATTQLMKYSLKKYGTKWVKDHAKSLLAKKIATRLVGDVIGAGVMASTTGAARVAADYERRMTGQVDVAMDDKGDVIYNGVRQDTKDNPGAALFKALSSTAIENWSEMAGNYLGFVNSFFGKALGKTVVGKAGRRALQTTGSIEGVGLNKAQKFIYELAAGKGVGAFSEGLKQFADRTQWHGVINEYLEEEIGNIANAAVVGDMTFDAAKDTGVFNLEQNIDTFCGVALMGGFMSALNTAGYAGHKLNYDVDRVSKDNSKMFGGELWNRIRTTIDSSVGDPRTLNDTLTDLIGGDDSAFDKEGKKAVLKYAQAALEKQGAEMASYRPRMDSSTREEVSTPDGNRYVVTSLDKNGATISEQTFDNEDEAMAYEGELKMNQQQQDYKDYLSMTNKLSYPEASAAVDEFMETLGVDENSENYAETIAAVNDTKSDLGKQFQQFKMEKIIQKAEANRAAIETFEQENGWTPGTVKWLSEQDPMKMDAEGLAMADQARAFLEQLAYPPTEVHVEHEQQVGSEVGKNVVEQVISNEETIDPNNNAGKDIADQWAAAQQARQQMFANDKTGDIQSQVEDLESKGYTQQEILSQLETFTPEQQQVMVDYYNAQARYQSMMDTAAKQIDNAANRSRQRHTFKGTINGQADVQNVQMITDGTNQYYLVSGNVTTDSSGQITGSTSGLIIGMDLDGSFVQLGDADGYSVMPVEQTLDQFEEAERTRLQEEVTTAIDPTGSLSQPQPTGNGTQQDGNAGVEAGGPTTGGNEAPAAAPGVQPTTPAGNAAGTTGEEIVTGTALDRIPKDEGGNPIYEQGAAEDTYDVFTEMAGSEEGATALAQSELNEANKRLKKLQKEREEQLKGNFKGKTIQEKANEMNETAKAIEAEQGRIKYWNSVLAVPQSRTAAEEPTAPETPTPPQAPVTPAEETPTPQTDEVPEWRYDNPEAARARGYKMIEGHRVDRQEEMDMPQGMEVEVQYSTKDKVKGRMTVSELADVQNSHLPNGQRNEKHFLPEVQPKAEFGADRQLAAQTNAKEENFRPELMLTFNGTQSAYSGSASQTNRRREIIQGHGRKNLAEYIYAPGNEAVAKKYKDFLKAHAAELGTTAEEIDKMEKPFAHIVLDVTDDEAIRLGQFTAQDLESGGQKIPEVSTVTTKLGDRYSTFANIVLKHEDPDASLSERIEANADEAVKWLNNSGVINNTEAKTLLEDKAACRQFIKDLITDQLFKDAHPDLRTMFYELPKNIQSAIISVVGREVAINKDKSILKDIQESIRAFHELITSSPEFANAQGANFEKRYAAVSAAVNDWLRQINIDGTVNSEKFSNFALELAKLYKSLKDQKTLAGRLRDYYDLVSGAPRELGVFDAPASAEPISKEQAIKQIFGIEYGRQGTVPLAGNNQGSEEGGEGSTGSTEGGESKPEGTGQTNGGRGNTGNGEVRPSGEAEGTGAQSERERFIAEHPLTEAEIDAANASAAQKILAKAYLNAENEESLTGMHKAAYTFIYNKKVAAQNKPQQTESKPEAPKNEAPKEETPKAEAPKETPAGETAGTENAAQAAARAKMAAALAKLKKHGKKNDSQTDAYSVDNLTPEQIEDMFEVVEAGAELGYTLLDDVESKDEWIAQMREAIAEPLKDATGYNDTEVDELLNDMWEYPYAVGEQTKTVGEWASEKGINVNENNNGTESNGENPSEELPGSTTLGNSTEGGVEEGGNNEGQPESGGESGNGSVSGGSNSGTGTTNETPNGGATAEVGGTQQGVAQGSTGSRGTGETPNSGEKPSSGNQGKETTSGNGGSSQGTRQNLGSTGSQGKSGGTTTNTRGKAGRTRQSEQPGNLFGEDGGNGTNDTPGIEQGGTAATVPEGGIVVPKSEQGPKKPLADISKEKSPYKPASTSEKKFAIGSVIPSGIADSIANAFKRLKEKFFKKKTVVDFVREELGYKSNEEMLSTNDGSKDTGLAAEQVDAVALAIGKMKEGKSFIVGDMTGVGKGRTAAALIRWGLQHGKKVLFVTEKSGLFSDMYRDLTDIGCDYLPFVTNNDTDANITDGDGNKVIPKPMPAAQKALWQSESDKLPKDKKGRQYDFVMTTYSQVSGTEKGDKRKAEWLKEYAKDAIVIMDESHNASGDSNTGAYFREVVENASGVTFLSATYAKRPDNMLVYAIKSSMSAINMPVQSLLDAIKEYGVAMQELMASALFGSGEMIRRERDMSDVKTTWTDPKEIYSEEEHEQCRKTSDKTMSLINDIIQFQRDHVNPIVSKHEKDFGPKNQLAALTGDIQTHAVNTAYTSQVSNITNLMVYAMKAKKAAEMAIEQIKQGKKPVIAVSNTMGSYIDELGDDIPEAGFRPIFDKGIRFSLRYVIADYAQGDDGKYHKIKGSERVFDAEDELDDAGLRALDNLRRRVEEYMEDTDKVDLSLSPIDLVKQMIADAGYSCGEITGRSTQLVRKEGGGYTKAPIRQNKKEAARKFNGGSKDNPIPEDEQYQALVLNVAGATGISLHSSKKFGNQQQRTMIILQPNADVNKEVQMRGRIDRTGQVHRGEYFYMSSPIPAEQKITMMLKQKLASLDAQSVGTKQVSSNKVEGQDMDNKYGDEVCYNYLLEHLNDVNAYLENGLKWNNKKREFEGRPGLLYDVLKEIQRMPCEMQEKVISELSQRYADQMDYLNQNGINDLETTTMDLEAVTIDKATFVKGKDNESENEFAHDSTIERVEVNVLKKPMRSSDIKKKMKELDALDEDGLPKEGVVAQTDEKVKAMVEQKVADRQAKYDEQEAQLEEKIRSEHPQKEGQTDEEWETMVKTWPTLLEMQNKHKADIAQYSADLASQQNEVYKAAMYLKPGRPYLVPLTDDVGMDAALMYGRFLGFQMKNGDPRQVQAVFAVKDSRAMITIPVVNKSKVIDKIIQERGDIEISELERDKDTYDLYPMEQRAKIWDEWWDKMIPKNTNRQIRYMITGNVLQACDSLGKYKGQIVTFTRKNKETGEVTLERGMILAENFDPENFKIRREVEKKDVWDSYDEVKDDRSGISCHREGDRMVVKFEKRKGEKLADHPAQKDQTLKDLAMNNEIRPSGKTAILCVIKEDNVEKALEHLYKEYGYTKEELFVMPDSTEKPDAIVRSNRPYQEIIDEYAPKYGSNKYTVGSKIRQMLKRYKMDVNNEGLKNDIREAVQLRQAYLRKDYAAKESNRLAWEVLILDQRIEQYKDDKDFREESMRRKEAILEELEYRGFKGTALHLEQGKMTLDDVRKLFDQMNDTSTEEGKAKKALFEKVMAKLEKLPMEIYLNEKIDNDTGGFAGGRIINYNWKYMNADYIADQAKADTILHEMIHTVTAYADRCVEDNLEHLLDQDMVDAINELHSIFDAIKNDDTFTHDGVEAYGLTNVREMLSEAGSNSEFRADLKKTGLWARLKAGFLAFFGIKQNVQGGKQVNAFEQIMERLDYLIENFKQDAWEEYYKGTRYGGYGYKKADAQKIDTSDPMEAIEQAAESWKDERADAVFNASKKLFGTTTDIREAGYILPDGTMLDFSGRHQLDEGQDSSFLKGRRTTDHREIANIAYERDGWTETGLKTSMPDFIKMGAIRIDDNAGLINLDVKPTDEQLSALRRLIARNDGEVQVDFGDGWDSEGYIEYDEGTKPQRVFADINRFFDRRERRINDAQRRESERMFDEDETDNIEIANERFNNELEDFKNKTHRGLLHLGRPQAILRAAKVNARELTLSPTVLHRHLKKHGLTINDLKGLAAAIQKPILVYNHGKNVPNKVVVTELDVNGGKLSITLELDSEGHVTEIDNVRSIHSKEAEEELERLSEYSEEELKEALGWVEKDKVSDWLGIADLFRPMHTNNPKLVSIANILNNFENPNISDEFNNNSEEINQDYLEDADEKAATESQPTEQKERIAKHIDKLTKKLGTKSRTTVYRSFDELPEDMKKHIREREKQGRKVRGWYENGRVYLYLPNIDSEYQAERTIWHETVGHYGLRRLIGEENLNKLLDRLWMEHKDGAMGEWVTDRMQRNGWKLHKAIEEYLAREAEEHPFEDPSLWKRLQWLVKEALHKIGFATDPTISDIQYLFWQSQNQLREGDVMGTIKQQAFLDKLNKAADNDRMFDEDDSPLGYSAKAVYDDRLNRVETVFSESYQDAMVSLKTAQNAIAKDKEIPDSQNAYMAENLMHGKNKNEQDLYNQEYRDPLIETINKIMNTTGMNWGDIDRYVYTKSGLERNREFFVRDWLEAERKKVIRRLEDLNGDEQEIFNEKARVIEEQFEDGDIDEAEKNKRLKQALQESHNEYLDDLARGWQRVKGLWDTVSFPGYLEALDVFIHEKIDEDYDPSKHDYSGFRAMYGDEKGKYDEQDIIDELMNTEDAINTDPDGEPSGTVDTLWEQIRKATRYGLERYREAGMRSDEQIDQIEQMFHWYVPMRGFKEDRGEDMYQYFTGKGKTKNYIGGLLKHAKGRGSEANYPISTIFAMTYKAIADCNQNLVNQKLYRLCQANPNDLIILSDSWAVLNEQTGLWEESSPEIPADASEEEVRQITLDWEEQMKELAKENKAMKITGRQRFDYVPMDKQKKSEHEIDVRINGKPRKMFVVGNPRMAQALNGQLRFENGKNVFSKWNSAIKNFMASLFTSYSPTFALRNMFRDWTHFRMMLGVREGNGYAKQASKYYRQSLFKMVGMFKKYREGTLDMNNEMERDFKDFMDNGGVTGYVQMQKIDDIQKQMEEIYKKQKEGKPIRLNDNLWDKVLGAVEAVNEGIENNARFATYRASRHYAGRTKARSAYDAKEITVNFNRKGAGGKTAGFKSDNKRVEDAAKMFGITSQILGEGRIFFNATVQAIATTFKNFQNPDGTPNKKYISKWAAKYALPPFMFGLALPYINKLLAAALGGDDDDPYANLPEWVRRKNICIYVGNDNFITIPIGQELAAFLTLGDIFAGNTYAQELKPVDRGIEDEMLEVMNTFSPVDISTKITRGGITEDPISEVTGRTFSVLAPLVAVEQNLGWTGRPVYKEDKFNGDKYIPEYQQVYSGTNPVLVGASKLLHEVGGGNETKRGKEWSEVNPAIIQYLWEQYTGGPGKVFSNTISIGKDVKDAISGEGSDFNMRKVEGLKAFIQQGDDRTQYYRTQAKFFKYQEDAEKFKHDHNITGLEKQAKAEDPAAKLELDSLKGTVDYLRYEIIKEANRSSKKEDKVGLDEMRKDIKKTTDRKEKRRKQQAYNVLMKEVVDVLDEVKEYEDL